MTIEYKNQTDKNVEIKALVFKPGEGRKSGVLIKDFDEAVEKGELSLIIDDGYRKLQVKPVGGERASVETPAPPPAPEPVPAPDPAPIPEPVPPAVTETPVVSAAPPAPEPVVEKPAEEGPDMVDLDLKNDDGSDPTAEEIL